MNVVMFTNTFLPHVGGVARAVETLRETLRARGHRVVVVAPEFDEAAGDETDVIRAPAVQHFNGSDFAVAAWVPAELWDELLGLPVDVVHSHHPFLLGGSALRHAASLDRPLVFTHHTRYEDYTHYVPGDLPGMRRFVIELATGYANLCDAVIAPSESIASLLVERGVQAPVHVVPTGVDAELFAHGDGAAARRRVGVPPEAWVVGHVGRLAPEKNLAWLAGVLARFVASRADAHVLVVGCGPSEATIRATFGASGLSDRLHVVGVLERQALADAYHAMNAFAFASHTETQGLVLAEALTAGVPVVALDAPGAREIVRDGSNGHLLRREDASDFAAALTALADLPPEHRARLVATARETAAAFSRERCTDRLLEVYASVRRRHRAVDPDDSPWATARRRIAAEWEIWRNVAGAAVEAVAASPEDEGPSVGSGSRDA
jgi:glycosyltransferase involved in cell wall biosynthesis